MRLSNRWLTVLFAILVEGGLALLALILGWFFNHPPLHTFHWSGEDILRGVLATAPLLLLLAVLLSWPIGPFAKIRSITQEVLQPLFRDCSILELLVISILAGVGEEMLFRGVLQPAVGAWLGSPWWGLLIVSVVFGLCHSITFTYSILATVMGAYLGWVWLASENLSVPIFAHALYDFLALLILIRFLPGSESEISQSDEPTG